MRHKHSDLIIIMKSERNTDLLVTEKHKKSNQSSYANFADSNELICCWYITLEGSFFNGTDPERTIHVALGTSKHTLVS